MANPNNPRGLFPINQPSGNLKVTLYRADTSDKIYKYDPVILSNDGKVKVAPNGDNTYILGVAVGFMDLQRAGFGSNLELKPYLPASTEGYVVVCDDPEQKYLVQCDTGGTNFDTTNVGNTCGYAYLQTTSGNDATGISRLELDQSDAAADTAGAVKILEIYDAVDNTTGNWAKVVVKLTKMQNSLLVVGTAL